jgi:hypothetical protein
MGNCCGSESKDNFRGEGHTVGSSGGGSQTTSQPPRPVQTQPQAPAKSKSPPKVGGPGRTLGSTGSGEDARSAAARAAEVSLQF